MSNDSQTPLSGNDSPALRWFVAATVFAAMAVVTTRLIEAETLRSANDRSRWCTVWSIVERGTYQIDEIQRRRGWSTIDRVKHNDHFYSTKPPLLPRIVAEVYRLEKLTLGWNLDKHTDATIRLILFVINVVPYGFALWLFCRMLCRHCNNLPGAALLVVTACWGTLLNPFLTTFNNHTVAATFLMFSLVLAVSILVEGREETWRYVLCGMTAAFTCCNELPAAAFGLALFFLMWRHNSRKAWTLFAPAALVPIAAFMITNYQATGGWKPFYLFYGTEKYVFVHEGIPSYWADPQGVDRSIDTPASYFFHCTVGHHGVLSLSPVFALALVGWILPGTWKESHLRALQGTGLVLTVVVFLFYMSKTENYNFGGVSVALRWVLWLIPFWLLAMLAAANTLGQFRWFQLVAVPLLGVSIFSAWYPKTGPWTQPWLFDLMTEKGYIDYSTPRPQFSSPHRSWIGKLPTSPEVDPNYWVEFTCLDPDVGVRAIRLEDGGPVERNGENLRLVRMSEMPSGATYEFYLRPDLFSSQEDVKLTDSLWLPADLDPQRRQYTELLQGLPQLPRTEKYRPSRIRPVKTGLRVDAFMCHIGSSAVRVADRDGNAFSFSREVWFCSEVPFGTLQFEDSVQTSSRYSLSQRYWQVSAMGRMNATSPVTVKPVKSSK
ncbi:MAG: DUF2029 domain-containing protein [Planctomycetaceae bacterium]|nr:DUF2029 domain-containing protein [Planctomycetaceae bacterium]